MTLFSQSITSRERRKSTFTFRNIYENANVMTGIIAITGNASLQLMRSNSTLVPIIINTDDTMVDTA